MSGIGLSIFVMFCGLAGGIAVGSGLVAFLVVLNIIPRLAQISSSYAKIHLYEGAVVFGALFFTVTDFSDMRFHFSPVGTGAIGLFHGVFVGMLAAALTEVLNVLPILAKRLRIDGYMVWLLMAMVFGKVLGSLFDWLVYSKLGG